MAEIKLGRFGIIDIESNGYSLGLVPGCNIAAELSLRPNLNLTLGEVATINALATAEWTLAVIAAINPIIQKTTAQITKELEQAVDRHIDSVARADKWDSRVTCAMRAGYPNPWQNKAIAFGQWMDACYAHCIQVQAAVAAGTRPVPTESQLISELPIMVWPA